MRIFWLLLILSSSLWARGPEPPLQVPAHLSQDVPHLADYLCGTAHGQRHKAERIYQWIAHNISYDVVLLRQTEGPRDCSPATVLHKRQSICQGYADLFTALGQRAGLEVETVVGLAKGLEDQPSPHAWNAVKIENRWALVDCTWGAGYLNDGRFIRNPHAFYFMADPKLLITTHFPGDPRWQLLEPAWSQPEFRQAQAYRPQHLGSGTEVVINEPEVKSPSAAALQPRLLASFHYRQAQLLAPKSGPLNRGPQEFHLNVPGAVRVLVNTPQQLFALPAVVGQPDFFRARVPLVTGRVVVSAEFVSGGRAEPLVEYFVP